MHTSKRTGRARWAAAERLGLAGLVVASAATATFVGAVATAQANPADYDNPLYVVCMRSSAATADALEHYVDVCARRAREAETAYDTCIRATAGSPDAREHWIEPCAEDALAHAVSDHP